MLSREYSAECQVKVKKQLTSLKRFRPVCIACFMRFHAQTLCLFALIFFVISTNNDRIFAEMIFWIL